MNEAVHSWIYIVYVYLVLFGHKICNKSKRTSLKQAIGKENRAMNLKSTKASSMMKIVFVEHPTEKKNEIQDRDGITIFKFCDLLFFFFLCSSLFFFSVK